MYINTFAQSPASAGVFGGLAAMQGMFAGGEKRESKANDLDIAQLKQLANDKQHEIDRLNSELVRERSKGTSECCSVLQCAAVCCSVYESGQKVSGVCEHVCACLFVDLYMHLFIHLKR